MKVESSTCLNVNGDGDKKGMNEYGMLVLKLGEGAFVNVLWAFLSRSADVPRLHP